MTSEGRLISFASSALSSKFATTRWPSPTGFRKVWLPIIRASLPLLSWARRGRALRSQISNVRHVYGDVKTCLRQIYRSILRDYNLPTRLHLLIRASAAGRQRLRRQLSNENQIPTALPGCSMLLTRRPSHQESMGRKW